MKIAILLLLSLATSVLCAEEFVFPKELKLDAVFPSDSKVIRHMTPSPEGDIQHTIVSYAKDGVRFALIVDTPVAAAVQRNVERGFEIAKEAVLANPSVKLVKEESVVVGPWKGRRYVFEEEGKVRIEQRLFVIGDSLYTFGVGAKWTVDFEAVSKDFFASIKIMKPEPNQALQHNDPSCHESCLRTPRASCGRG